MKHLFKVYCEKTEDFLFNGEWLTEEEANNLIEELKTDDYNKCGSCYLWAYIVIERSTGNIVNGYGLAGINDLLNEDNRYQSNDYMIQANFTLK